MSGFLHQCKYAPIFTLQHVGNEDAICSRWQLRFSEMWYSSTLSKQLYLSVWRSPGETQIYVRLWETRTTLWTRHSVISSQGTRYLHVIPHQNSFVRLPEESYQATRSSEIVLIKPSPQIQTGGQDPNGIVESKSFEKRKKKLYKAK